MLVAIVPPITAMLSKPDLLYWATAFMASAFLSGGVEAVRARHARAVKSIGRRITFAMLARRDALTELPNRLALREWYDDNIAAREDEGLVAVHYLDLNGFKPVNDTHGHPVGDALLAAVGKRIARTIREADMAARLGGDEFAVIQRDIAKPEDVILLANRLQAAIARPFKLDDLTVRISTCVGYVISCDRSDDLEHLLGMADEALYRSKRGDRRAVGYELAAPTMEREAA
jgi:diguanylate cyclase (GGDEF)-like protein